MARLHRPYIPFAVRVIVAERQLGARFPVLLDAVGIEYPKVGKKRLDAILFYLSNDLFGSRKFALDHDPALVNRRRYVRNGKTFYDPPANDPAHLVYREAGPGSDHDIKTRVRGDGAQLSDLAKVRKRKRKERKAKAPKRKWPSRPLRSASRWPIRRV